MDAQDDRVASLLGLAHAGHEDVARHGLHDILDQLAVVGLQQFPLAGVLVDALVNELPRHLAAELIVTGGDVHVAVAQVATAGQPDADVVHVVRPASRIDPQQAAHLEALVRRPNCRPDRALDVVPQLLGRRVRLTPCLHDLHDRVVVHGVEHVTAHLAVGTEAAAVASGQLRHLALRLALALRDVVRVLAEDAPGGHLVQVRPFAPVVQLERLDLPVFARQPRQHAPFDVRQVGDDQFAARGSQQRPPYGEGAALADVVVDDVFAVVLEGRDSGLLHVTVEPVGRARQVLGLKDTARVAPSARGPTELDRAAQASVARRCVDQHLVLGR